VTPLLFAHSALAARFEPAGEGPGVSRFGFSHWDVDDGLPQASVTDIDLAAGGELVMGTFGGLAMFDGSRFAVSDPSNLEGLPSARITAIAAARDDALWIGTQYGAMASLRGGRVSLAPPVDRTVGVVWDLAWREDGLWAATDAGLLHLDQGRWTAFDAVGPTTALTSPGADVWAAGRDGVLRVAAGRPQVVSLPTDAPAIAIAVEESADRAWVVTFDGLVVWSHGTGRMVLPQRFRRASILVDPAGRLWLAADGELALLGDADALADGTPDLPTRWAFPDGVGALFVDRDETLWVGTDGEGLVRVREHPFHHYGRDAGLQEASAHVVDVGGEDPLVAGGCYPLMALREGKFAPSDLGAGGCVGAVFRDALGTWIGEEYRVLPPEGSGLGPIDVPGRVLAIGRDAAGALWIGTEGAGAWTVTGGGAPERVDGIPDGPIPAFAGAPDGAWWVALPRGIAIVRDGRVTVRRQDFPDAQVRAILFDPDGTAWIGTYGGGLLRMAGDDLHRFSTADGLPENVVSIVLDDGRGYLWMNGNRGVFRVSRSDLLAIAAGRGRRLRATLFDTGEGNGGNTPVGGHDSQGRLWFATLRGAVSFDPAAIPDPRPEPLPRVEEVRIEGRRVAVRFSAPVLAEPRLARFEYRLLPTDREWRDAGESRAVDFPELAPGDYVFEVRAANGDGVWSPEPARAPFRLAPLVTETAEFRLGALLLLFVGVGTAVALRVRSQRAHTADLQAEIGRRRQVEADLRVSEAHYRQVFEGASDGMLVAGSDERVLDANPAASAIFGRPLEALRDAPMGELVDTAGAVGVRGDGTRFPAKIAIATLEGDRTLASVVDIGPEIALRTRLEQAERLEANGRLAGGVAHDFNNLLMIVQGNTAELAERLRVDPVASEAVRQITRAAERGADLTRQLLLFGRRQLLRPLVFDAGARVTQVEPMLRRLLRSGVTLEVTTAPGVWVRADPAQLELALVNLVLNAVQAIPGGGTVAVRVGPLDGGDAAAQWPQAAADRGWGHVSVSDTGAGIPAEILPKIFEPFFTTRAEGGTGLGLAGVHGFAAQSHGHVFVRSTVGQGTTFDLLLPRADAVVEAPAPSVTRPPPNRGKVVVCDDDPLVLRTVQRLLQSGGYTVFSASAGTEALELLAREDADLLVTDVLMPGMNGVELADRARAQRPGLRVVFASGYTRDLLPQPIVGELLAKPFTREALLRAIERTRSLAAET
jgi:signal transduction histidine kinase/ligand-binding sensor domain-containing protein/CheY-like chemotaxis protein